MITAYFDGIFCGVHALHLHSSGAFMCSGDAVSYAVPRGSTSSSVAVAQLGLTEVLQPSSFSKNTGEKESATHPVFSTLVGLAGPLISRAGSGLGAEMGASRRDLCPCVSEGLFLFSVSLCRLIPRHSTCHLQ